MNPSGRKPGFRLSWADAGILLSGAVITWWGCGYLGSLALLLAIVLLHFFLFCNVFRIRRKLELIWAALFVVNVLVWSLFGQIVWWYVLVAQAPITLSLIAVEIRSDRYHGIGYSLRNRGASSGGSP
jgi:hypothetical protein